MLAPKPDFETRSTVKPQESIVMTMDTNETSMQYLFKMLSGLYADKQLAVLRELSTNALDSHLEAGQTRPIEVTTPAGGQFGDNNLVIQDWGVGMSRDDIFEVYSRFGSSTKRDTNKLNGLWGVGSKSPLAYTEQYTFVGTKDGIKTTVSVAFKNQVPHMDVLSEKPTDEPNGVKIIIPARAANQFKDKADHLFRFWNFGDWKADAVLINGKKPVPVKGLQVTNRILVTNETGGQDYVVQAGIPYPVTFAHTLVREHALVCYVDTGTVEFTPDRENLDDTSKSREVLAALLAEYERNIHGAVQKQIEGADNPRDAFKALAGWREALGAKALNKQEFSYKGRKIPVEFAPKDERVVVVPMRVGWGGKVSEHSKMKAVKIETVVNALCVYNFKLDFTASHKRKLEKYVEDNKIEGVDHIVMADQKLPTHWLDKKRVVDFEVIRAIKLPRQGGAYHDPNRIKGSYDLWEQGDYNEGVPASDIDTSNPIFYTVTSFMSTNDRTEHLWAYNKLLKQHKRGSWTLVELSINRVDKFKRDFPQATDVTRELTAIYKRIAKHVTDDERKAKAIQKDYYLKGCLRKVDPTRLDDPAFTDLKRLLDYDLKGSAINKLADFRGIGLRLNHEGNTAFDFEDPFEKYPIITATSFNHAHGEKLEHLYLYMNAAYAKIQSDKINATRDYNNERG